MYPDLLGVFGVTLYGTVFERVLWILGIGLMIWGIVSSVQIFRKGKRGEGFIQGAVVLAILIWFGVRLYGTFQPDYALTFSEPLVLHSYAFMILIGIGLGIFTVIRMSPYRDVPPMEMAKLCLWLVLFGFLGARLAHVIVEHSYYWNACFAPEEAGLAESDCLRVLNFAEGGLTFYGGVIAGMAVILHFMYKHRKSSFNLLTVADLLSAPLAIAHACGRIGCLAAGCCWGAITTGTIGVRYDAHSFAYDELMKNPDLAQELVKTGHTPLMHATQLYETFGELVLYAILWVMLVKKVRNGLMVATWLACYGVLRFVVEIMRDDTERGSFFDRAIPAINEFFNVAPDHNTILSTSQGIACVMFVLGMTAIVVSRFTRFGNPKPESAENIKEASQPVAAQE